MRVKIEKLITGGRGLGRIEGKVCFIPFVIPGETVEVQVTGEFRHYTEASILSVLEASEDRTEAFCPYFGICGGCSLQHMSYSCQLRQKQILVRDIFLRTAGMDPGLPDITASPERGARNRVQIHSDGTICGFKSLKSDQIVSIESCPAVHPSINEFLEREKKILRQSERTTVFACDDGVWFSGGTGDARVKAGGKTFVFSPDGFFQSNLTVLETLLKDEILPLKGHKAIDFYCGAGLFSSFLSDRFDLVTGIESSANIDRYYKVNTAENSRIINKPVEKISKKEFSSLAGADLVIADPPRKGLSEKSLNYMTSLQPQKLLYISCDPVTLARDTKKILEKGFTLEALKLYDFYPQTGHVESAAVFIRL